MPYVILTVALIALDQLVKWLVRTNIPLGESRAFIPYFVELTHWRNTGAAFSLFSEHTWILTVMSAIVSVVLLVVLAKKLGVTHPAGRICLAVVLAGAVGNLIDRAVFGYVVDMFRFLFVEFAIFNVADICLTLGVIALCIYLIFFYDRLEKKDIEHDRNEADV